MQSHCTPSKQTGGKNAKVASELGWPWPKLDPVNSHCGVYGEWEVADKLLVNLEAIFSFPDKELDSEVD